MRILLVMMTVGLAASSAHADDPRRTITVRPVDRPSDELPPLVKGVFGETVQVHSDARSNQLIVVGNRNSQRQVRKLVRRLDRDRPSTRRGRSIVVHRLQHQRARDVKATLDALRGSSPSRRARTQRRTSRRP